MGGKNARSHCKRALITHRPLAGTTLSHACRTLIQRAAHFGVIQRFLLTACILLTPAAAANVPVVSVLCDYEDDSVAASITEVRNVRATDCRVFTASIPARGQRSLAVEIGATAPGASVACDLRFRIARPFFELDRVATYAWVSAGAFELSLRVRDANGVVYETPPTAVRDRNRWVRVAVAIDPKTLRRADGDGATAPFAWPIEIQGYRCTALEIGRQTIHLDDLEVEHQVPPIRSIRGEFRLSNPTQIYPPGSTVRAAVVLENLSRRTAQSLTVQLGWLRVDGSELTSSRSSLNLPAGGADFRSIQPVDFSQQINEPGLYRLVARVLASGWITPATFETIIAVTPSNRALPRGRSTFFGVRSNLLAEPPVDQRLEIELARELGVQLLMIRTPWRQIEPRKGHYELESLTSAIDLIVARDMTPLIMLAEPPDWVDRAQAGAAQADLLESLARRFGPRVRYYAAYTGTEDDALEIDLPELRRRVAAAQPQADVLGDMVRVSGWTAERGAASTDGVFVTRGAVDAALEELDRFGAASGLRWSADSTWMHHSESLTGSGALHDAVQVLRFYMQAAARGVGSVIWCELRDETNDARFPETMRGLVRRDFSPRTPLIGYANTVGMLSGLVHSGPALGAPEEFESAVFLAGNRQAVVLLPRPNRILPAVLAPILGVPGELEGFDFERRKRTAVGTEQNPLFVTTDQPLFLTLATQRRQDEPRLSFVRPWLELPSVILCGESASFTIRLTPPSAVRTGYVQLALPSNAPLQSTFTARGIRTDGVETLEFPVSLSWVGEPAASVSAIVRVSLERNVFEVPLDIRRLTTIGALAGEQGALNPRTRIAELRPVDGLGGADFHIPLHAEYRPGTLLLAVELPAGAAPDAELLLGIAAEGADEHREVRVTGLMGEPVIAAEHPADAGVAGWRCLAAPGSSAGRAAVRVEVPAADLGLDTFSAGQRLLVAVRYSEPPLGGFGLAREAEWGQGLGGTRSSRHFEWVELAGP